MKNLYQDVCTAKVQWDKSLPEEFMFKWKNYLEKFEGVQQLVIPRKYLIYSCNGIVNIQLHAFSDASQRNFATSIYLRFEFASGLVESSLVNSKSRVLSKNIKVTIPRAELLGAVLMADQTKIVLQALKSVYTINECFYWLDSAIVYAWILNESKKHDKYVTSRLEKIRSVP